MFYIKNESYETAKKILHELQLAEGIKVALTFGDVSFDASGISEVYNKLDICSRDSFYKGIDILIDSTSFTSFKSEPGEAILQQYYDGIISNIDNNLLDDAISVNKELFHELRKKRYDPQKVQRYLTELLKNIEKRIAKRGITLQELYGQSFLLETQLRYMPTLISFQEFLERVIKDVLNNIISTQAKPVRQEIKKAIELINKNYMKDLSLNYISEEVNISKNHFCRIFKEEVGENFTVYLNKIRIQKAKLMIEKTNHRIKEIANSVGINDYRYFCKIFKEATGLTPLDFKKQTEKSG